MAQQLNPRVGVHVSDDQLQLVQLIHEYLGWRLRDHGTPCLPDDIRQTLVWIVILDSTDPNELARRLRLDRAVVEQHLAQLKMENLIDTSGPNTDEIRLQVDMMEKIRYMLVTGYLHPDTPDVKPRFKKPVELESETAGIFSLVEAMEFAAGMRKELIPIELDGTGISPRILTRTVEEAQKAEALGWPGRQWQSGVEESLADKPVVMTFRNDAVASALLPRVFSLKVIDSLPDTGAKLEAAITAATERRIRLIVVEGDVFLEENIPAREVLLETVDRHSPILYAQSINQIFAWRGTGKTNIAFGIASALATGGRFLRWQASKPTRVLYVEGELPASQMQERMRQIIGKTNGYLRIITLDKQPAHEIPSLATALGQMLLEESIGDAEVLILDSISTLFNIATNDEENWLSIQNWLKRLRSKGLCIIFLHHAGKSGLQRGSSKAEDLLDISIKLTRPEDYRIVDGLRCNIEFDKTRGVALLDGEPIEVQMQVESDRAFWTFCNLDDADFGKACTLFDDHATVREVAKELNVSTGKAANLRKRWQDESKKASQSSKP